MSLERLSRRRILQMAGCAGGATLAGLLMPGEGNWGQLLAQAAAPQGAAVPGRRPNIIFILADDLGYGDVGVLFQNARQGHKPAFSTPNLDAMAAQGMLLRQHYTGAPVCAPARASLLTGQHQGHCPIRDNEFDWPLPEMHTLGSVLQQAGYHTGIIGKWGLAGKTEDPPAHPLRRGFDDFFGFLEHGVGHTYYHSPKHPLRDGFKNVGADYQDIYSTDLFTARAKKFITEQARGEHPFFLYLAYTAVHNALNVPGEPYPAGGGKNGGMQWPLKPTPQTRDTWIHPDYAPSAATAGWTDPMRRYATMARRLDDGVGDLMQLLRDLDIDRDTLVIFTSDNGPANEGGGDPRFFDSWGPFDGFKRDCWEGGVREPTIVRWPSHIAPKQVNDTPSGFWDWMPTLAELAGQVPPAQSDGVSLLPTLVGRGTQRSRGYLYVEYNVAGKNEASDEVFARKGVTGRGQQQLVRIGDFVGVRTQITSHADPLRLYNVTQDPHEDHNLAGDAAYAGLLARMKDLMITARRPDLSARRPYDHELLPALDSAAAAKLERGMLSYAAYDGKWPWTPDFDVLTPQASGLAKGLDLKVKPGAEQFGLRFGGYLEVPADGEYAFYLLSDSGGQMWLHESHLFDSDRKSPSGELCASAWLKAGWHPLRLFYRHETGKSELRLDWAGPGPAAPRQQLPMTSLAVAKGGK